MRYILTLFTFLLIFSGCASKNAFDKFNMQEAQERSANNLESAKIKSGANIEGIVSAIYLNKVYPNTYNTHEYFYVYLYLKDEKEMFNPNTLDDIKLTLKLNKQLPLKVKKLPSDNKFSNLTSVKSKWQRYYLVVFEEEKRKNAITLQVESEGAKSDPLIFLKDEE